MRDANELRPLLQDPEVRRWGHSLSPRDWIRSQNLSGRHAFAVTLDGAIAGHVALKTPRPLEGEIGYWTAADARRRGVATWAVNEATTWALTKLGIERVTLIHNVANEGSCAVALRCGYRLDRELPPIDAYPLPGHLHVRERDVVG